MNVAELIEELKQQPQDADVVMFDGPSYYTPSKVYMWQMKGKSKLNGKVVID